MSARQIDQNGYVYIKKNPIAKSGVFPYTGRSIGAPEPDRIYKVYRPAEELSHPDAMDSFRLTPLVDEHTMLGDDALGLTPAEEKGVHGVTGSNVVFEGDTLYSDIKVFSKSFANRNKAGKKDLSCGYRCRYEFTPGVFNGQAYDAIQRTPRGNHVALVKQGRMGPEVAILDHFTFDAAIEDAMDVEALIQDAMDALPAESGATVSPELVAKIKAALEAALGAIAKANAGEMEPVAEAEPKAEPEATEDDADPQPNQEAEDMATNEELQAALDAATTRAEELAAQVAELQGRPTLDAADVMGAIAQRDALAAHLKPFVGAFDHAPMTLDQVAKYGVEKLELTAPEGHEVSVLGGYLKGAPDPTRTAPAHGLDAAPVKGGLIARKLAVKA